MDLKASREMCNPCEAFHKGKEQKLSLGTRIVRSAKVGEIIHSDLSGKITIISLRGSNYYVTFIEECAGYVFVVVVSKKSNVSAAFKRFQICFERKHDG